MSPKPYTGGPCSLAPRPRYKRCAATTAEWTHPDYPGSRFCGSCRFEGCRIVGAAKAAPQTVAVEPRGPAHQLVLGGLGR
jgi:hypothetical protein